MKGTKILSALLSLSMLSTVGLIPNMNVASAATAVTVRLDPSDASPFNNGKFEGWGTALCWWANRIGYNEELTNAAAEAFFSENGLSLDIARYNLGGGDNPNHDHITRSDSKVPGVWKSFKISEDGKNVDITEYDLTKDQNQLNVAKAALKANPNLYFEGFSNSAPYFMTVTDCTSGGGTVNEDGTITSDANKNNLKDDMYDDFAKFIADATALFKNEGIEFKSYSPMNEPDTNYWGAYSPKQEGCHFDPGEKQSKAIIETRRALDEKGLTDVLVAGMDETSLKKTANNLGKLTDEAKTALGRVDTHTYSDRGYHAQVKAKALELGKNLWMSEVDQGPDKAGRGGDGATLADMIITDMNGMQPAAWVMWDIIDAHKDADFTAPDGSHTEASTSKDYTDGVWGVGVADHDESKLIFTNKYYTYGQFTKYINPGDTIIASSANTLAAYNKDSGDIKIVAHNSGSSDLDYIFDLSGFANVGSTVKEIRTDMAGNEKWAEITGEATLNGKTLTTALKAHTVTTYVISGNTPIENYAIILGGSDEINRGDEVQLTLGTNMTGNVSWAVDHTEIAEISSTGLLTAKKPGQVTVTATIDEYTVSRTYNIIVYANIKGPGSVSVGKTVNLTLDTNAEETPHWSVDNTSLATITQSGALTAVSDGRVTVTVTVGDLTATKVINLTLYTLSGTASWSDAKTAPKDSDDYTQVADGNFNTAFDGTKGGWVMYDYGEPFQPTAVKLAARNGGDYSSRTVGGTVQGSNDGIEWTELYKITSAIPANQYTTVAANQLKSDKAYRYFRYTNEQNLANIAEFLIEGTASTNTPENAPVITDIAAFTDNFENDSNIFNAPAGTLSSNGNQVYASGLARFGNVFVPVADTAISSLTSAVALTNKDRFRLCFHMFSGWESNGKENTLILKDDNGGELIAIRMTGSGYTLQEIRIGGKNVLSGTAAGQCRSNLGSDSKAGANGWGNADQPYRNTVGFNKTAEIIIDGTGTVSVSLTGGMADTTRIGKIDTPIKIKSLELKGGNGDKSRVVSYDNFDGDVITYADALPMPPEPVDPPVLPADGKLIGLDFENNDLTSSSSYGKATGTPKFVTENEKKCVQFDNTSATTVKLTDANGNSLLTEQDALTIAFRTKPTSNAASWLFFAAPDDSPQEFENENYFGVRTEGGNIYAERYKNKNSRPASVSAAVKQNEWNDIVISVDETSTTLYVNGVFADKKPSAFKLSDMLGSDSVAYIGKANWNTGEFAQGFLDDFVIYNKAFPSVDPGDLSAVKGDLSLPASVGNDDTITWTSSNTGIITNAGKVTRPMQTTDVTLTAEITKNNITVRQPFTATVLGLTSVGETFTAYSENGVIKFNSEYTENMPFDMYIAVYDDADVLKGVKKNTAAGSFENLEKGKYQVFCYLWNDDMQPICNAVKKTITIKDEQNMNAYLFAHFIGDEKNPTDEQVYFSVSEDGLSWTTLNGGSPVLTSNVSQKGIRDPYIFRGVNGEYYIIATDLSIKNGGLNWTTCQTQGSRNIIVWESTDLINWECNAREVAPEGFGCVWAPEAIYDAEKEMYMVFWASKVSNDSYAKQRMYKSYTKDFVTFTAPEIYIDRDHSMIDTTILQNKGVYYRFTKDETDKYVFMEKSASLDGNWSEISGYNHKEIGFEGPTIYKLNGQEKWCLMLDNYGNGGYKPFVTDDLSSGVFTDAGNITFDAVYRHGTVMPITAEELNHLKEAYPTPSAE